MKSLPRVKPISLARHGIDRDYLTRGSDGYLSKVWASGAVPVFEHRGSLLVAAGGLFLGDREQVREGQTAIYLGRVSAGTRYIGVSLADCGLNQLPSVLAGYRCLYA